MRLNLGQLQQDDLRLKSGQSRIDASYFGKLTAEQSG
jgi:hypothetical protein